MRPVYKIKGSEGWWDKSCCFLKEHFGGLSVNESEAHGFYFLCHMLGFQNEGKKVLGAACFEFYLSFYFSEL